MNDQWSGKTLFRDLRAKLAAPSRSSNQLNSRRIMRGPPSILRSGGPVPEPGSDRLGEVAARAEEPRAVRVQLELGERSGRGSEHHLRSIQHVERGLVAGALELVEGRQVQAHRATGMGADLRVADVALRGPSG